MSYRIMALQETGEEILVASGIATRDEAYDRMAEARLKYEEWRGFQIEYEKTLDDYARELGEYE